MATSLTTRLPGAEQDSLSVLLPQLSMHLESASPEAMEQEIRHALKRLATDVNLDDAVLTVFELEGGAPRRTKVLTTGATSDSEVGDLATEPWLLEKTAALEPVLVTSDHDEPSAATAEQVHRLWDAGIRAMFAASWKTRYEKIAAAILCFRGGRDEAGALSKDRSSVLEFAKRVGMLLVGRSTPAIPEVPDDRRIRSRFPVASTRTPGAIDAREDGIVGESGAWRYVMFRVDQVAETQATVLLLGETGTGKELVARAIHRRSTRRHNRFVALNCSALPATLIESELFGRERGAFTGASMSQAGRFELAHRGTLFLDEAGDLPLELQPKLLRVLQEGQLDRLGSTHTTNIDVRVIAATNRDLMNDVRNDRFRRDLYYRLNVFPITLPALRERVEDIPLLASHFLERFSRQLRKPVEPVSKSVMRVLQDHHWPGNIRELENVIQRAIILSSGGVISINDVCLSSLTDPAGTNSAGGSETTLQSVERDHILRILASTAWRIEGPRGAARALGLKPSTLRSRLQKLSIRRAS
jgi:transcriptional regulator with GAF, ATPase, and Fis domain